MVCHQSSSKHPTRDFQAFHCVLKLTIDTKSIIYPLSNLMVCHFNLPSHIREAYKAPVTYTLCQTFSSEVWGRLCLRLHLLSAGPLEVPLFPYTIHWKLCSPKLVQKVQEISALKPPGWFIRPIITTRGGCSWKSLYKGRTRAASPVPGTSPLTAHHSLKNTFHCQLVVWTAQLSCFKYTNPN